MLARAALPLARSAALAALAVSAAAAACGGSQQTASDLNWTPEENEEDKRHSFRETEALEANDAPPNVGPIDQGAAPRALVGVRPDLSLSASAPGAARCSCLMVDIGAPSDPKFQWQGGAPNAGPGALAIAVSSRGIDCPGGDPDETKRRPSISAVDVEGNDVVVEIEELPDGPPLAAGALLPQPGPFGSVYIRPRSKGLPYARPEAGARCKVR